MYQSPIELILKHIAEEQEKGLYHHIVYRYGINVDKEELIKALQYDRDQYDKGYQDAVLKYRKIGKWELHDDGSGTCSNCRRTQKYVWDFDRFQNYCGCCGAEMDV